MFAENEFMQLGFRRDSAESGEAAPPKKSRSKLEKIIKKEVVPTFDYEMRPIQNQQTWKCSSLANQSVKNQEDQRTEELGDDVKYIERYNQLNSLPIHRVSSLSSHKFPTLQPIAEQMIKKKVNPSTIAATFLNSEQLKKDKCRYPLKYKICCEQIGLAEEKVFRMKEADVKATQQEYLKQKGMKYLKESRLHAKPAQLTRTKTQLQEAANRCSQSYEKRDKNYVREIFAEVAQLAKTREEVKLSKHHSEMKMQRKVSKLHEYQDCLGQIVYKQTVKHLYKVKKRNLSYLQQLGGQQKVDDSIINFLRLKIKRANTVMN